MDRSVRRWQKAGFALVAGGLGLLVVGACFTGADGIEPPLKDLYFPTGMLVSPGRTSLFVANSDFDLQYSGGTVQVANLADVGGTPGIRSLARTMADQIELGVTTGVACAAVGATLNLDPILYPGPCEPLDYEPFVRASATTGAFASGMRMAPRLDGTPGARLFVAVRGDPSVTFFDVTDDRDPSAPIAPCGKEFCLECEADAETNRCGSLHRVGDSTFTSSRGLKLPTEPVGLDLGNAGDTDAMVVAHQTAGAASLVVNRWPDGATTDLAPFSGPALEFTLDELAEGPTGVAHIPRPAIVGAAQGAIGYREGFVVTHRAASTLTLLRYEPDAASRPPRPFLIRAGQVPVSLGGETVDQRGIAIDSTERESCESLCFATELDCLEDCLDVPLRLYVASRSPAALLVGTVEADVGIENGVVTNVSETVTLAESVPLSLGPSGVSIGRVVGLSGKLETRVFVVSFDARFITIYDPAVRKIEAVIRTGRGPFGMAFDTGLVASGGAAVESFLYVGHFTDSYVGVVDLDTRRLSYATMMLSLGPPTPPREEQ